MNSKKIAGKAETLLLQQTISSLIEAGNYAEAWEKLAPRLKSSPRDTGFLDIAARLCRREKKYDEAIAYSRRSLAVQPRSPGALNGLALAYYEQGNDKEAEKQYRKALALLNNYPACHNNLGVLLQKLNRHAESIPHYQQAINSQPSHHAARYGLASALAITGQLDKAEEHLRYIIKHEPQDIKSQTVLGMILLQRGQYAEGWPLYQGRYSLQNPDRFAIRPKIDRSYWQGEALEGKKIMVYPEQGLGDEIQFSRFVSRLKTEKGASAVYLICRKPLIELFRQLPGVDKVIEQNNSEPLPNFDVWSMLLDLPQYFLHTPQPFALLPPYCFPREEDTKIWSLPANKNTLRVGVAWKGNPQHKNDHYRSLSSLEILKPLWSIPGIDWFSLQKGAGEEEAQTPSPDQPINALGHRFESYTDTVAVISQLDLVITVDTSVAHLAGAMNKACWTLIPSLKTDWRWMQTSKTTPWYPSMRLYFSDTEGQWDETVLKLRDDLQQWRDSK